MMLLRHDQLHDQKLFPPRRTVDLMIEMEATRYRPERLKPYIHYGLINLQLGCEVELISADDMGVRVIF